jgi:spore germination protein GerM
LDRLKLQAVHHTLREFEDISKVTILVEGQPYEGDSGFSPWLNSISEENTNPTPSDDERHFKILIYLADEGGHLLIPVTRRVDIKGGFDNGRVPLKDLALEAINQLINGPEESEKLAPTVPKGVELRDFYIKDNTAYVDIGKEIIIKNINKEINEKLAIESIVYTLTSLSGIDQVQFLIDGKVMGSISGSVNISKPIKPSKWINPVSPDGL